MSIDFDGGTVKDFQGLEFTLKAGNRTLEEGTDYTLQYPYIILSESLEEEELTLSVNADSLGYTGGSVTAKRADGTFVLPLTPWGKLHITTAGTFAGDNHILVFNQKGDGYLLENDTVMMNTSKKEGVFYLTLVFSKTGAHSIAAAATKDGMTAPIGSAAITVQEISLCPDTVTLTALKGNSVLVTTAPDTKVVTGYSDTGKFGPADKINREQMAVMMYRYANYKKYDTSQKADFSKFVDAAKVSAFAEEAMQWAVGNGIITGKDNGIRLDPQGNATRAECAAIIQRFIEKYGK